MRGCLMKAYLDANVFIYSTLNNESLGESSRKIIEEIQKGNLEAITSVLTFDEIMHVVGKERGQEAAILAGEAFLNMNNLEIRNTTRQTALTALQITREYGMKARDAMHYATMVENGCTAMVSEDKDFNGIKELKRRSIKEFVQGLPDRQKDRPWQNQ